MSSWKECKLGDIAEIIGGGTPSTSNNEFWNGNIPWLTPRDLTGYSKVYISHGDRFITESGLKNSSAKLMPKGSVLLTSRAPIGYVVIAKNEICTNQGFKSLVPNFEILNSEFLYYWLKSNTDYLQQLGTGTTFAEISGSVVKNIDISLPHLEEQKAIAEVLSSLDDKIDLLHRQNQTLESLAQTIFRQWFEDKEFDGIIGDIIKLQSGYAFKSKDFQDFGIHGVLKIKNISNSIIDIFNTDFIDLTVANKTDEKFKILSGDILFGMTGAEIGKMGIVPKTDKNLWLNQRVGVLREKYLGAKYLAYLQLTSEFGFDYITNTATGSAQPNISASEIEQCPFVKLEVDEIENYSNEISPLFEKIIFNLGQIQILENLRDTLLPKLLSGEVRVVI
ncbi:MAG: restriction endonuclease subunit S [Aliarcobacter skirrowii]|uniref:restriction endonuclease subunit S n=1 Tax=Aliarcobacter skirrowii TaxID=28200 RepID=UPI00242EAA48|nr:restriction endonuclease subunit S [Aliarcobacter skirrowii]MDD2507533.1 restriction endonuclease subunit S [Aliarcobacter skirrowii]MDD3495885.1 restriction endonuclease subunit S [Aliarcobacter skirrowii]